MATIIWGTMTRTKSFGIKGDKMKCWQCHREYSPNLLREAEYFHINYIPISHHKDQDVYNTICPICGFRDHIQQYRATEMIGQPVSKEVQDISYLAVQKAKNLYDFVALDNLTKEQILIAENVKYGKIKGAVRYRGGKPKDIIKVV